MVEIPSHFFEHFLQDSRCLKLCARHYSTCDAISQSMQAALQRHWNFMPALDMNDQVILAEGFTGKSPKSAYFIWKC